MPTSIHCPILILCLNYVGQCIKTNSSILQVFLKVLLKTLAKHKRHDNANALHQELNMLKVHELYQ